MSRNFSSLCYCTNARRIAHILSEYYDRALEPVKINVAQFCLLRNLERIGQGNLTEWAEQTGVERSTMVRNARKLVELELIKPVKGRGKIYTLSEKGEECLRAGGPLWNQAQQNIEALLGEELTQALLEIGKKIQSL